MRDLVSRGQSPLPDDPADPYAVKGVFPYTSAFIVTM